MEIHSNLCVVINIPTVNCQQIIFTVHRTPGVLVQAANCSLEIWMVQYTFHQQDYIISLSLKKKKEDLVKLAGPNKIDIELIFTFC